MVYYKKRMIAKETRTKRTFGLLQKVNLEIVTQNMSSTMRVCGLILPPHTHIKVAEQKEFHGEIEKIKGNVQPRKLVHPAWIRYDGNWISENNDKGCVEDIGYTEDGIAEAIFDLWISGKPYKQWYADKYLHLKFDFGDDENVTTP